MPLAAKSLTAGGVLAELQAKYHKSAVDYCEKTWLV